MKLGIALSGGGIRGIAHAGVLKALEENNIQVDAIGGTSSGSLIASLYAMGYSPYYIYILFKRYAKDIVNINASPIIGEIGKYMMNKNVKISGLNTGEELEKVFNQMAKRKGINKISDIKKMPIIIPTVDISKSEEHIFTNNIPNKLNSDGKYIKDITVGKAIRASSSFPGVFCPCGFKGYIFADGGVLNNIPVIEVKKQGVDKVIAVKFDADTVSTDSTIMDFVMKTLDIMNNKMSEDNIEASDYVLTVKTDQTGLLDIEKLDSCYKYGYEAVMHNIDEIKKIIAL